MQYFFGGPPTDPDRGIYQATTSMSEIWGPPVAIDLVEHTMAALRDTHAYIQSLVAMRDMPGDPKQPPDTPPDTHCLVLSWQDDPDAPQACNSEILRSPSRSTSRPTSHRSGTLCTGIGT